MQDLCALYDVAELGMAQISTHRAGTACATEELARALQSTPGCDLQLMASDFQGAAAAYCRQRLPGTHFTHAAWQRTLSRGLYRTIYPVKFMHDDTRQQLAARVARVAIKGTLAPFRPFLRRVSAGTLQRADVYHAPSGVVPRQIVTSEKQRAGRKLPIFVTVHDLLPVKHPEYFPRAREAAARSWLASFSKARWYLCSSENTRADLLETGRCDPAHVFVTPLAAGEEFYPRPAAGAAVRAKYGLGDAPYLLSVCTLEPRKNLDTVIRTFLRLVREESHRLPAELKLVLVGTWGWMHNKIRAAYAEAGDARDRIIFTGHVPQEDLPALYSHALAFVYLSLYEGFGLPVLEAMRCGLPVVTSNTSSLPEVAGGAGILQDPRDEDALAQNLKTLCSDAVLRADLSRRSLEQAASFSWARCARLTFAAYRTALESGG